MTRSRALELGAAARAAAFSGAGVAPVASAPRRPLAGSTRCSHDQPHLGTPRPDECTTGDPPSLRTAPTDPIPLFLLRSLSYSAAAFMPALLKHAYRRQSATTETQREGAARRRRELGGRERRERGRSDGGGCGDAARVTRRRTGARPGPLTRRRLPPPPPPFAPAPAAAPPQRPSCPAPPPARWGPGRPPGWQSARGRCAGCRAAFLRQGAGECRGGGRGARVWRRAPDL